MTEKYYKYGIANNILTINTIIQLENNLAHMFIYVKNHKELGQSFCETCMHLSVI